MPPDIPTAINGYVVVEQAVHYTKMITEKETTSGKRDLMVVFSGLQERWGRGGGGGGWWKVKVCGFPSSTGAARHDKGGQI